MEGNSWRTSSSSLPNKSNFNQSTSRQKQQQVTSSHVPRGHLRYTNNSASSSTSKQYSGSSGGGTQSYTPTMVASTSFQPSVGQKYVGKIWNVLTNTNRIGMYCKFGEERHQWYPKDGFIKNIICKPSGQLYQHGDEVEVICTSTNPIFLALLPAYVRPLLILDVNGPLGNRTPYEKVDGVPTKRTFVTRKYTPEFLDMCSQYYEIAVWSCAKRNNIELQLFSKVNLLFVWSQEESTSLYPRTSFVSPAKPLFLKELSKVFEKYPSYDYTNTVLLENHLEKFERNRFGSGIICPDFDTTKVDEDEVLNPHGELAHHLLGMAAQHPINIVEYIRSHTGTCSLFPIQYPVPPEDVPRQNDMPAESSSQQVDVSDETSTEKVAKFSDHDLLWNYLLLACNRNSKVAQQCIDQKSLPGPKSTPFRSSQIADIRQTPDDFVVCEKTDGDRAILVISPEHKQIYFVYRNHKIERIEITKDRHSEASQWYQSLPGITVLDGELVSEYSTENRDIRAAYLCFDAVFVNGEFIGTSTTASLLDRINCAQVWFTQNSKYINSLLLREHDFIRSKLPVVFQCKKFHLIRNIEEVSQKMTSHGNHGWVYEDSFPHLSDGLVFTPIQLSYYDYMAIKWKPVELCTNDYWISVNDLRKAFASHHRSLQLTGYLPISNKQSDSKVAICQIKIEKNQIQVILQNNITASHLIAECYYDKNLSVWRVHKMRFDKATPNTVQAAWSNLEVISEGLTFSMIVSAFQNLDPPNTAGTQKRSQMETIDQHYNQIQHHRHTGSRDARIAMHRKVMNWSKACLLQHTVHPASFTAPSSLDEYMSSIQSSMEVIKREHQQVVSVPNFLKAQKGNFYRKRDKKSWINVVDLACGRGGDIKKFTSESSVGTYLGIDISEEQIKECTDRAKENHSIKSSQFVHGDAGDGQWHLHLPSSNQHHYDIAWCMFAFHYFCDTEIHCRNFFASVSYLLKPSGKFTLTIPNPYAIYEKLTSSYVTSSSSVEDPICSVRYSSPPSPVGEAKEGSSPFPYSLEDCLTQFGIEYYFTLGDAVQNCPEYLVPLQRILLIAQEYGFYLLSGEGNSGLVTMNRWIEEVCLTNENYLSLRNPMQVCGPRSPGRNVSDEEWNAISLYLCLTFIQLKEGKEEGG